MTLSPPRAHPRRLGWIQTTSLATGEVAPHWPWARGGLTRSKRGDPFQRQARPPLAQGQRRAATANLGEVTLFSDWRGRPSSAMGEVKLAQQWHLALHNEVIALAMAR